ncbi:glycosyltransferase family 39 protein, partial [bacterium]|nr:glycosyltransferase family 39 protein [bacterium]
GPFYLYFFPEYDKLSLKVLDRKKKEMEIMNKQEQKKFLLRNIVYIVLLLYLTFHLFCYFRFASSVITFPYDIDSAEGQLLNEAFLLSRNENIYRNISSYPFTVANYPPIFPLVTSLFVQLFGLSLLPGRFLSVISTFFIGFFVFKIVQRCTKDNTISLIAGLFFFLSNWVIRWSVLLRVDMFGILLCLIGIYLFLKYENHPRKIFFSAIFFILALYTKQSLLAAPLSLCLYLLLTNRKRLCFKMAAVLASAGIGIFLVLNFITHGQFRLHTVSYTISQFSIENLLFYLKLFFKGHWPIIILAASYFLIRTLKKRSTLTEIYFVLAFLVALTVGKAGASINYLIEFWMVSCILLGLVIKTAQNISGSRLLKNGMATLILVTCLVQFFLSAYIYRPESPNKQDRLISSKVYSYFAASKGDILSEYPTFLLFSGKEVLFQPFSLTQLSKRGIWNQRPIVEDIQKKRFSLILLSYGRTRWTDEMLEAIKENYILVQRLEMYRIWGRKPPALLFIPKEPEKMS